MALDEELSLQNQLEEIEIRLKEIEDRSAIYVPDLLPDLREPVLGKEKSSGKEKIVNSITGESHDIPKVLVKEYKQLLEEYDKIKNKLSGVSERVDNQNSVSPLKISSVEMSAEDSKKLKDLLYSKIYIETITEERRKAKQFQQHATTINESGEMIDIAVIFVDEYRNICREIRGYSKEKIDFVLKNNRKEYLELQNNIAALIRKEHFNIEQINKNKRKRESMQTVSSSNKVTLNADPREEIENSQVTTYYNIDSKDEVVYRRLYDEEMRYLRENEKIERELRKLKSQTAAVNKTNIETGNNTLNAKQTSLTPGELNKLAEDSSKTNTTSFEGNKSQGSGIETLFESIVRPTSLRGVDEKRMFDERNADTRVRKPSFASNEPSSSLKKNINEEPADNKTSIDVKGNTLNTRQPFLTQEELTKIAKESNEMSTTSLEENNSKGSNIETLFESIVRPASLRGTDEKGALNENNTQEKEGKPNLISIEPSLTKDVDKTTADNKNDTEAVALSGLSSEDVRRILDENGVHVIKPASKTQVETPVFLRKYANNESEDNKTGIDDKGNNLNAQQSLLTSEELTKIAEDGNETNTTSLEENNSKSSNIETLFESVLRPALLRGADEKRILDENNTQEKVVKPNLATIESSSTLTKGVDEVSADKKNDIEAAALSSLRALNSLSTEDIKRLLAENGIHAEAPTSKTQVEMPTFLREYSDAPKFERKPRVAPTTLATTASKDDSHVTGYDEAKSKDELDETKKDELEITTYDEWDEYLKKMMDEVYSSKLYDETSEAPSSELTPSGITDDSDEERITTTAEAPSSELIPISITDDSDKEKLTSKLNKKLKSIKWIKKPSKLLKAKIKKTLIIKSAVITATLLLIASGIGIGANKRKNDTSATNNIVIETNDDSLLARETETESYETESYATVENSISTEMQSETETPITMSEIQTEENSSDEVEKIGSYITVGNETSELQSETSEISSQNEEETSQIISGETLNDYQGSSNLSEQEIYENAFLESGLVNNIASDSESAANQSWVTIRDSYIQWWTDNSLKFTRYANGTYKIEQQDEDGNWVAMGWTDDDGMNRYYNSLAEQNAKGVSR